MAGVGRKLDTILGDPSGQSLKLVAYTPSGGDGDLYLIDYSNSSILHKACHLHPGYSDVTLRADKIGRTMIVLTVENQSSNALVMDILPPIEVAKGPRDIEQFSRHSFGQDQGLRCLHGRRLL